MSKKLKNPRALKLIAGVEVASLAFCKVELYSQQNNLF